MACIFYDKPCVFSHIPKTQVFFRKYAENERKYSSKKAYIIAVNTH